MVAVSAVGDENEIRGPMAEVVDDTPYTWGPQQFAGFYYDIDDDLGRETITMNIINDALEEDTTPRGVVYRTEAQEDDFEFEEWGKYYTIGFLAEEYFAGYVEADDDPKDNSYLYYESEDENLMVDEQLSKILTDDDEEYTFTTGTPLKLAEGYELSIKAIDLDGDKVYVELYKNGKSVDSAVVEPSQDDATMEDKTYAYTIDLGDTEDIVVVAVHFKNAFRGAEQDLATVDGIWQISDTYADVEEDTEYDKMTIQTVNSDEGDMFIEMDNEDNKITLNKNKDTSLMENIRLRTADQDFTAEDPLRFYIYKELTEPGTYEIRGKVADLGVAEVTWDTSNFAGFYYDIDDDLGRETITMTITNDALEEDTTPRGVVYRTEAQEDDFEFEEWGTYYTIGFQAEEYFAGYVEADAVPKDNSYLYYESEDENLLVDEQLSKILTDDDEEYTFTTGTPLKLAEGYELSIKAIDLDGDKVYVELYKDGKSVDSAVVEPSQTDATMEDKTYAYTIDLGDTEDIVVIAVHFKNAFRGAEQDLATVDGIWQISDTYADVEEDTEYGKMTIQTVNSDEGDMFIEMDNEDNKITLNKNKDTLLMENIRIKTADQTPTAEDPLRFYIYEELVIEGEEEVAPEPVVSEPVVEEPVVEEPVEEEAVVEEPVEEEAVAEEPAEEEPADENGGIPGFEAVFAITGLLAVSYLVLRRRD